MVDEASLFSHDLNTIFMKKIVLEREKQRDPRHRAFACGFATELNPCVTSAFRPSYGIGTSATH